MMELGKLLNADLSILGRQFVRGLHWWLDELRAMLPDRWRRRRRKRPRAVLWPVEDEFRISGDAAAGGGLVLCLSRRAGLVRAIRLPPLPPADLRRLVALDLDRLGPFEPQHVLFDLLPGPRGEDGQSVLVGLLPRTRALAMVERARAQGFRPTALALADGDGRPCFDFLAGLETDADGPRQRLNPARAWAVAVVLLAMNLLVFVGRDVAELAALRQQVEDMQPGLQAAAKLRAMVEAEATRRTDLLRRQQRHSPLPVLDVLSRSLPDGTWVQRLEWDGARLHVVVWSRDGADPLALIEAAPLFANAHPSPPASVESPARGKPFDITADRETEGRP